MNNYSTVSQNKTTNILFFVLIFSILALAAWLIYYINTESFKCFASPLTYGVSKLNTGGSEVICRCSVEGTQSYLLFNKDNISIESNPSTLYIKSK